MAMALFRQSVHRGLLKHAANLTGVTVRKIRTLDHEQVSHALDGIDPCLGAPRATVAKGARRQHRCRAYMRRPQNTDTDTPTVVFAPLAKRGALEKACGEIAGLYRGKN